MYTSSCNNYLNHIKTRPTPTNSNTNPDSKNFSPTEDKCEKNLINVETCLENENKEVIMLLAVHAPKTLITFLLKLPENNLTDKLKTVANIVTDINHFNIQQFFLQISQIEDTNFQCKFMEYVINNCLNNQNSQHIRTVISTIGLKDITTKNKLLEICSTQRSIQTKIILLVEIFAYGNQFDLDMQHKIIELVDHKQLIEQFMLNIFNFDVTCQGKIINKIFSIKSNNNYILIGCICQLQYIVIEKITEAAQKTFWQCLEDKNCLINNNKITSPSFLQFLLYKIDKFREDSQLIIINAIIQLQNEGTNQSFAIDIINNIGKLHPNIQVKFFESIRKNSDCLNENQAIEIYISNIKSLNKELQLIILDKIFNSELKHNLINCLICEFDQLHGAVKSDFILRLTSGNHLRNIDILLCTIRNIFPLDEEYQIKIINASLEQFPHIFTEQLAILNCIVNISSSLIEAMKISIIEKLIILINSNTHENSQILYNVLIKCITNTINHNNLSQINKYLNTILDIYSTTWLQNFLSIWIKKINPDDNKVENLIFLIRNISDTHSIEAIEQLKGLMKDYCLNEKNLTKVTLVLYVLINNLSNKEVIVNYLTQLCQNDKLELSSLTLEEKFNQNKELMIKSLQVSMSETLPMQLQATDLEVKTASESIGEPTLYALARSLANSKLYLPPNFKQDAQNIIIFISNYSFFTPFKLLLENLLSEIEKNKNSTPIILTAEQQKIIFAALWGEGNNMGIVDCINNDLSLSTRYNLSAQITTNLNSKLYYSSESHPITIAIILDSSKIDIRNIIVHGTRSFNKIYPPRFDTDLPKSKQSSSTQQTYLKIDGIKIIDKGTKSNGTLREKYAEGTLKKHFNKHQLYSYQIVHEVLYQPKTETLCSFDYIQGIVIDLAMLNVDHLGYCIEYRYEIAQLIEKFVEIDPFFLLKTELFVIYKELVEGNFQLVLKKLDVRKFAFNPEIIPSCLRVGLKHYYSLPSHTSEFDYLPRGLNGIQLHTEAVLHNFIYYFEHIFTQLTGLDPQFMKMCLALHDIGKGIDCDTTQQHLNSTKVIEENISKLQIEERIAKAIIAIIAHDPLGELIKSGNQEMLEEVLATLNKSYLEIAKCFSHISRIQYFELIKIYYLCDISSYANLKHLITADTKNQTIALSNPYHVELLESLRSLFIS